MCEAWLSVRRASRLEQVAARQRVGGWPKKSSLMYVVWVRDELSQGILCDACHNCGSPQFHARSHATLETCTSQACCRQDKSCLSAHAQPSLSQREWLQGPGIPSRTMAPPPPGLRITLPPDHMQTSSAASFSCTKGRSSNE